MHVDYTLSTLQVPDSVSSSCSCCYLPLYHICQSLYVLDFPRRHNFQEGADAPPHPYSKPCIHTTAVEYWYKRGYLLKLCVLDFNFFAHRWAVSCFLRMSEELTCGFPQQPIWPLITMESIHARWPATVYPQKNSQPFLLYLNQVSDTQQIINSRNNFYLHSHSL